MGIEPAGGTPVAAQLACQTFSTTRTFGDTPPLSDMPILDAIATISSSGKLGLMPIHRSADGRPTELTMNLEGFVAQNDAEIVSSVSETWSDRNRRDIPQKIEPCRSCAEVRDGVHLKLTLPRFNIYVQLTIYLLFTSKSEGYLDEGDTKMEVTVQATEFANIKLF